MRSCLERAERVVATAVLLVGLAACGGDSVRPPVVVVTPEPVHGVIAQTTLSGFEPNVWVSIELILSQRGVLDITVDWTFPSTWMYVYFGNTNCGYDQLASQTCPFILSSATKDPKPRVLFTETLEPGTYYLVLYNAPLDPETGTGSTNTESLALQLGLTVSASGERSTDAVRLGRRIVLSPPRL
jgi:hypothetical protein